ncbi:MAG: MerC domain-containing protein [Verrucomicrobiota bacterium]
MIEASPNVRSIQPPDFDIAGVGLAVLCAIHCAVTPVLLIFAPAFGKIWSHPASHWLVALFVVPLAIATMRQGYRKHRKKWILACGTLGVALVLVGSAVPYLEKGSLIASPSPGEEAVCTDSCCPSIHETADGDSRLHIPLASIVTTLGGFALIATHVGNLRACPDCRPGSKHPPR